MLVSNADSFVDVLRRTLSNSFCNIHFTEVHFLVLVYSTIHCGLFVVVVVYWVFNVIKMLSLCCITVVLYYCS